MLAVERFSTEEVVPGLGDGPGWLVTSREAGRNRHRRRRQ
jgi:hypothetical protein